MKNGLKWIELWKGPIGPIAQKRLEGGRGGCLVHEMSRDSKGKWVARERLVLAGGKSLVLVVRELSDKYGEDLYATKLARDGQKMNR